MSIYKKIAVSIAVAGLSLLGATPVLAAFNDVTLSSDMIVNLSALPMNITMLSGSTMASYVVNTNTLVITMNNGSSVTLQSGSGYTLANDFSPTVNTSCSGGTSTITLTSTTTQTVTIAPTFVVACGGNTGGGGGGGGGVTPPAAAPTATFSANYSTVTSGQAVTLTWSSSNATSVSIDQGVGVVASSGTKVVNPTQTTTYTLTASGSGGTTTKSVTVTVGSTNVPTTPPVTTPAPNGAHVNGTLVLSGQTIFLIKNGQRYGFRNPDEYMSHGYKFSQAVTANTADMALTFGESNIVKAMEGTLVLDTTDNRTVYMVGIGGTKRGFANPTAFTGLGYSFTGIPKINMTDYPAGPAINSATEVHPDGALVLDGQTVWWIRGGMRQGFESEAVFGTYGFSFSHVVKANAQDLALPQGSLVKFRDGTLVNDSGSYYIISDGLKLPFASSSALTTRGYSLSNTINASLSGYVAGGTLQ